MGDGGVLGRKVRAIEAVRAASGSFDSASRTRPREATLRMTDSLESAEREREGEQGFLLVGVIVMVALVLVALSVAAPVLAKDLQRERELEAIHRGQQYTRAIRLYYKKFNAYPTSVKLLEGGQPNERYLRQHYLDPFTGKDDWRLIGVGQAKTTVKGFFGEPLGGLNGASGGLGSASGMQSGGSGLGNTGGTASGAVNATTPGSTPGAGDQSGAVGNAGSGSGAFGSSSFGQSSFGQSGSGSGGAFGSGGAGPFVGVGIPKDGASIVTLNEQSDYSLWEFLYDPRIEQLYAKSSIFGGGIATSSGGLGSASSLSGTPGAGLAHESNDAGDAANRDTRSEYADAEPKSESTAVDDWVPEGMISQEEGRGGLGLFWIHGGEGKPGVVVHSVFWSVACFATSASRFLIEWTTNS